MKSNKLLVVQDVIKVNILMDMSIAFKLKNVHYFLMHSLIQLNVLLPLCPEQAFFLHLNNSLFFSKYLHLEYHTNNKQPKSAKQKKKDDAKRRHKLSFASLIDEFCHHATLSDHYFMCDATDMKTVATLIESVPLSLDERYYFTLAPVNTDSTDALSFLLHYAQEYHHQGEVEFISPKSIKYYEKRLFNPSNSTLKELETFHHVSDLYLWLAMRFTDEFIDYEYALQMNKKCSQLIEKALKKLTKTQTTLRQRTATRREIHEKYEKLFGIDKPSERRGSKSNKRNKNREKRRKMKEKQLKKFMEQSEEWMR